MHIKRLFTASQYEFNEMDGKFAIGTPVLSSLNDREEVIDAATTLLADLNTALRLSVDHYSGFELHGVLQKNADGTINRVLLAKAGIYGISGASAVAIAGSLSTKVVLSREERLVLLLRSKPEIEDVASRLAIRPITWAAMTTVYETVTGLMSGKSDPDKRRSDYQVLIDRGWLTKAEADMFYHTAAHHRKGYPRTKVRGVEAPMEYEVACDLTKRLFWLLVDELQPA